MAESERAGWRDTRGEILALLCGGNRTVTQLADELGMSNNSVRAQLGRLEAEGLVRHEVVRQGVGKPAHEYQLTAAGTLRLSRVYLPLLNGLLSAGNRRFGADGEAALLREAGRMLAEQHPRPGGALRERLEAAVDLLGELGGITVVREENGVLWLEGTCCPLRGLVPDHPLACKAVETMIAEFVDAPVHEQCEKRDPPACRLVVGGAAVDGRTPAARWS